ncbi:MAG: hypothetical protein JXR97_10110 [Planctomycetes bacterium]|nr:hypothetical protein [Planctomycetota bacterium]
MRIIAVLFLAISLAPFAKAEEPYFPSDAVVDVTKSPYNAVPDDGADDTDALQKAITDNAGTGRFIFLPAGTYNINRTLKAIDKTGKWRAQLTLQGAGRDKTLIRLSDKATGFGDPSAPMAVLMTGSHQQEGDGPGGGGNKAFRNNIFDLTIHTGNGNPGAQGVEWAVSNHGTIGRVSIIGDGVAGISLRRKIPGPGLIKDVRIFGFQTGIDIGDVQYGVTIERLDLSGQTVCGLRISENLLHVRNLISRNRVPAALITGSRGVLTMVDSKLIGLAPDKPAIQCNGNILLRNVFIEGYRKPEMTVRGTDMPASSKDTIAFPAFPGNTSGAALIPVEETPSYVNSNPDDWQVVGEREPDEKDDTAAIQRAIDAGKSTIYFRNERIYFISNTVIIRGKVKQIFGFGAEINLGGAKEEFSNIDNPRPLFQIDKTDGKKPLFLDHMFFNAQYPGELLLLNNSPKPLVIRHCGGWVGNGGHARSYRNTRMANGKVFIEDTFLPGWEFRNQSVWARQFNPENWEGDGSEAQVTNDVGRLWILGFKTEGPAPFIATTNKAKTELLGAYNYISATKMNPLPQAIPYIVKNSEAFLSFTSENFRDSDYSIYIRASMDGKAKDLSGADLAPRSGQQGDRSFTVCGWINH